jgi:hypothetical protein
MLDEELLPLAEAAQSLPHKPHVATLYRWMSRGVRGVKLRTCLLGGRRYTSREALAEFIAETSRPAGAASEPTAPKIMAERGTAQKLSKLLDGATKKKKLQLSLRKAV